MPLPDERGDGPGVRFRLTLFTLVLSGVAAALSGCSRGEARVPVYPVNGKVTFEGAPPTGAFIILHPAQAKEGQPTPSGKVKDDGTFTLTSYDGDDGAPAGDYSVSIKWYKLIKNGSDVKAGPNVIPAKYGAPETSPWKVKVGEAPTQLEPLDIKK